MRKGHSGVARRPDRGGWRMSRQESRRSVLRTFAALAVLPAFAKGTTALADQLASITPPKGPMLLTRRLTRELSGGYSIVVERSFELRFDRFGAGFKVEGHQVASRVDAPPSLAAYARLEQQRVEDGLFPLELNRAGLITSGSMEVSRAALAQAVELALGQVKTMPLTSGEKEDARAFLKGLEQAAGRISSQPPADLFTPPSKPMAVTHEAALPGGLSGRITTRFSGSVSSATGLLEQAERVVSTEAAGTRRRTLEHWSLGELPGAPIARRYYFTSLQSP